MVHAHHPSPPPRRGWSGRSAHERPMCQIRGGSLGGERTRPAGSWAVQPSLIWTAGLFSRSPARTVWSKQAQQAPPVAVGMTAFASMSAGNCMMRAGCGMCTPVPSGWNSGDAIPIVVVEMTTKARRIHLARYRHLPRMAENYPQIPPIARIFRAGLGGIFRAAHRNRLLAARCGKRRMAGLSLRSAQAVRGWSFMFRAQRRKSPVTIPKLSVTASVNAITVRSGAGIGMAPCRSDAANIGTTRRR